MVQRGEQFSRGWPVRPVSPVSLFRADSFSRTATGKFEARLVYRDAVTVQRPKEGKRPLTAYRVLRSTSIVCRPPPFTVVSLCLVLIVRSLSPFSAKESPFPCRVLAKRSPGRGPWHRHRRVRRACTHAVSSSFAFSPRPVDRYLLRCSEFLPLKRKVLCRFRDYPVWDYLRLAVAEHGRVWVF